MRRTSSQKPSPPLDVDAIELVGFGLGEEHEPGISPMHMHGKHQLLYADRGCLELTSDGGQWLLPPQRAAWISAGVLHGVRYKTEVSLRTVYFDPRLPLLPNVPCMVLAVTPLAQEMIRKAMEWGPHRNTTTPVEEIFFRALGALAAGWVENPLPFRLPLAKTVELQLAMDFVTKHLAEPIRVEQVARAAGMSVRTLSRRFQDEAQTNFRDYLQKARMIRATELLAEGARVTSVAFAVGFDSPAAFSRAFELFLGKSPRDYRAKFTGPRFG